MALPAICEAGNKQILPVTKISITGSQRNLSGQLNVSMTFLNHSSSPTQICLVDQIEPDHTIRDLVVELNGEIINHICAPPTLNLNQSSESLLLENDIHPLGQLDGGHTCTLKYTATYPVATRISGSYVTTIPLTVTGVNSSIPIIKPPIQLNLIKPEFQCVIDIIFSNAITEIVSPNENFHTTEVDANTFQFNLDHAPSNSIIEFSAKLASGLRHRESRMLFTFTQMEPNTCIETIARAKAEQNPNEKLYYLAQASHGFQLAVENAMHEALPDYGGDVYGLSETCRHELITNLQPDAWSNNEIFGLYSIYDGHYIYNRVGKWGGRSQLSEIFHNFLTSCHAITLIVFFLICLTAYCILIPKYGAINLFLYFTAALVLIYLAVTLYFFYGLENPLQREVDSCCNRVIKSYLDQFSIALGGNYAEVGSFWYHDFFEPAVTLLDTILAEMAKDNHHPIYEDIRVFRSIVLSHRYAFPLIFAYAVIDPDLLSAAQRLVPNFRKVIVNGIINGSHEVRRTLEMMICNSFMSENERMNQAINMRHITMDTPGIVNLFKSVTNCLSVSPEVKETTERMGRVISNAEQDGTMRQMSLQCTLSPAVALFV